MRTDNPRLTEAAAVAAALGGRLATLTRDDGERISSAETIIILPGSRILLSVSTCWHDSTRLIFRPYVQSDEGRLLRLRAYSRETGHEEPEATVSAFRPARAIAADLRRRVLGENVQKMARATLQQTSSEAADKAAAAVILDDLADAIGAPFVTRSSHCRSDELEARGAKFSSYTLGQIQRGERFALELRLTSRHALRQILRIARADFEFYQASKTPETP